MATFLSLFSGIGGFDLGLERAGWECVGQCELDPYRRGILERHWPDVPRWTDVRSLGEPAGRSAADAVLAADHEGRREAGAGLPDGADLICGGFPCQDLSVAGKRRGLAGERSGLFFEFARVAGVVRPRWVLIENVPGLLSSHGGRDFAVVLATLADLGYGVAWRVLDSRYFGVSQRRRRVFVVGHLGADGPEPFLPFLEGGGGDHAASGTAGKDVAAPLGFSSRPGRESGGSRFDLDNETYIPEVSYALTRRHSEDSPEGGRATLIAHALTSEGHDASEDGTGRGTPLIAAPLSHGSNPNSNAAGRRREDDVNLVDGPLGGGNDGVGRRSEDDPNLVTAWTASEQANSYAWESDQYPTLNAQAPNDTSNLQYGVRQGMSVRRLTPVECCRLQGFPDTWLGGNEPPDSPRYAALGDAVTVPVAQWIGERLREAM